MLFSLNPKTNARKQAYTATNRLLLRKTITPHFKVETGLNYTVYLNNLETAFPRSPFKNTEPYKISLPLSVQYYLLPQSCRVQPYCGIGLQFDHTINQKRLSLQAGDVLTNSSISTPPPPGNKNISVLITQGFTYEVNTKIQVAESVHFVTNNCEKTLGIDIGIGYRLP